MRRMKAQIKALRQTLRSAPPERVPQLREWLKESIKKLREKEHEELLRTL